MTKKTIAPEQSTNEVRKQPTPGLAGPSREWESGQQLSSFTQAKLAKKTGELFPSNAKALK